MNIREFASNAVKLMETIPEEDKYNGQVISNLGVRWDLKEDTFQLKTPKNLNVEAVTKRTVPANDYINV